LLKTEEHGRGPSKAGALRLCLAGSGGGHVRQILDLEPAWSGHDYFFLTEDTALGKSLALQHRTHFVPHFAAGQARLHGVLPLLRGAVVNFFRSAAIMLRERPDIVVSTGAGAVFFAVLWGRLLGARVVAIESFARFDKPSLFGRLAAPLAHDMVVQSAALSQFYPGAKVYDPLRLLDGPPPAKKPLLFATVGATLPFDRLVQSISELKLAGEITQDLVIQTGVGGAAPGGLTVVETLPFKDVQDLLVAAEVVVCHGGTGSLITALREGCHVIAFPRLSRLGEHYDDHQSEITTAFAARGLIQVANDGDELRAALAACRTRQPRRATTDPVELIGFLQSIFEQHQARRQRGTKLRIEASSTPAQG
jgi:UDP-N-acetylglucosamine transferase subunit ALG13